MNFVTFKDNNYAVDEYNRLFIKGLDIEDITEVVGLDKIKSVKSLSLQNNKISEIKCLDNLADLEALFLYNNEIEEIKNLEGLKNLKTLILNRIGLLITIWGFNTRSFLISKKLFNFVYS